MGKKYQKKEPTGREYVDAASALCTLTVFQCMKLPERWKDVLLSPLIAHAQTIESLAAQANKVYINEKTMPPEALIGAYQMRIGLLQEALRVFASFDMSFKRLMDHVDISGEEKRRLKNILLGIIRSEKAKDPEIKRIEIKVISRQTDMQYLSAYGDKYLKLKITPKTRDHWLRKEIEAMEHIRKRIESDKKAISRLNKA